ncbi:MAG: hypothetical protein ACK53Y_24065, partial [bacterium]
TYYYISIIYTLVNEPLATSPLLKNSANHTYVLESTMENREIKLPISTSHRALKRKWCKASYLFSFLVANM